MTFEPTDRPAGGKGTCFPEQEYAVRLWERELRASTEPSAGEMRAREVYGVSQAGPAGCPRSVDLESDEAVPGDHGEGLTS